MKSPGFNAFTASVLTVNPACEPLAVELFLKGVSVQEIKEAVRHLSFEERAEIAACLHSWEDDNWDEQMKRDLATGKLDRMLAKVDADIAENKTLDMP